MFATTSAEFVVVVCVGVVLVVLVVVFVCRWQKRRRFRKFQRDFWSKTTIGQRLREGIERGSVTIDRNGSYVLDDLSQQNNVNVHQQDTDDDDVERPSMSIIVEDVGAGAGVAPSSLKVPLPASSSTDEPSHVIVTMIVKRGRGDVRFLVTEDGDYGEESRVTNRMSVSRNDGDGALLKRGNSSLHRRQPTPVSFSQPLIDSPPPSQDPLCEMLESDPVDFENVMSDRSSEPPISDRFSVDSRVSVRVSRVSQSSTWSSQSRPKKSIIKRGKLNYNLDGSSDAQSTSQLDLLAQMEAMIGEGQRLESERGSAMVHVEDPMLSLQEQMDALIAIGNELDSKRTSAISAMSHNDAARLSTVSALTITEEHHPPSETIEKSEDEG